MNLTSEQTELLEKLPRIMRGSLRSYHDLENWEDSIQEGLIRAWKDLEEGGRDDTYVVRRAKVWAQSHLLDESRLPSGHPGRERTGMIRKRDLARAEKVQNFVREYVELHDRKPSVKEVAEGVGISRNSASFQLRTLNHRRGGYQLKVDGDRFRLDRNAYKKVPLIVVAEDGNETIHPDTERLVQDRPFEELITGQENFNRLLKFLNTDQQRILTLYHLYDWDYNQIGRHEGITRQSAYKRIERAHAELRRILTGERPTRPTLPRGKTTRKKRTHCKRGHEFTEDNVIYQTNGRGVACKTCNRENRRRRYHEKKQKEGKA